MAYAAISEEPGGSPVGDFNETLHIEEQMGGNDREEWCMSGFREAVEYCGFSDLGYRGLPFTWDN